MPNDPRFERALEEYFFSERLSRRRFVGRAGSAGLAVGGLSTLLAACGGVEGTAEKKRGRGREEGRRGQPPEDRDRQLDVLELAALHRQVGDQGLQQEVRRQVQVRRGDQRQLRVLREDPPAARAGHADRPRHHHADRLPGLAPGAAQLRRADRQEERPERGQHGRQPQVDQLRPRAQLLDAVAVRRDRPGLQHQEDRARAHERQGPLRPEVQGPRHDALGGLRLREHGPAGRRRRRLEGDDRPDPRRDREDRQGQPRRPVPPLHRQRLHDGPREGQRRGSRWPTRAT